MDDATVHAPIFTAVEGEHGTIEDAASRWGARVAAMALDELTPSAVKPAHAALVAASDLMHTAFVVREATKLQLYAGVHAGRAFLLVRDNASCDARTLHEQLAAGYLHAAAGAALESGMLLAAFTKSAPSRASESALEVPGVRSMLVVGDDMCTEHAVLLGAAGSLDTVRLARLVVAWLSEAQRPDLHMAVGTFTLDVDGAVVLTAAVAVQPQWTSHTLAVTDTYTNEAGEDVVTLSVMASVNASVVMPAHRNKVVVALDVNRLPAFCVHLGAAAHPYLSPLVARCIVPHAESTVARPMTHWPAAAAATAEIMLSSVLKNSVPALMQPTVGPLSIVDPIAMPTSRAHEDVMAHAALVARASAHGAAPVDAQYTTAAGIVISAFRHGELEWLRSFGAVTPAGTADFTGATFDAERLARLALQLTDAFWLRRAFLSTPMEARGAGMEDDIATLDAASVRLLQAFHVAVTVARGVALTVVGVAPADDASVPSFAAEVVAREPRVDADLSVPTLVGVLRQAGRGMTATEPAVPAAVDAHAAAVAAATEPTLAAAMAAAVRAGAAHCALHSAFGTRDDVLATAVRMTLTAGHDAILYALNLASPLMPAATASPDRAVAVLTSAACEAVLTAAVPAATPLVYGRLYTAMSSAASQAVRAFFFSPGQDTAASASPHSHALAPLLDARGSGGGGAAGGASASWARGRAAKRGPASQSLTLPQFWAGNVVPNFVPDAEATQRRALAADRQPFMCLSDTLATAPDAKLMQIASLERLGTGERNPCLIRDMVALDDPRSVTDLVTAGVVPPYAVAVHPANIGAEFPHMPADTSNAGWLMRPREHTPGERRVLVYASKYNLRATVWRYIRDRGMYHFPSNGWVMSGDGRKAVNGGGFHGIHGLGRRLVRSMLEMVYMYMHCVVAEGKKPAAERKPIVSLRTGPGAMLEDARALFAAYAASGMLGTERKDTAAPEHTGLMSRTVRGRSAPGLLDWTGAGSTLGLGTETLSDEEEDAAHLEERKPSWMRDGSVVTRDETNWRLVRVEATGVHYYLADGMYYPVSLRDDVDPATVVAARREAAGLMPLPYDMLPPLDLLDVTDSSLLCVDTAFVTQDYTVDDAGVMHFDGEAGEAAFQRMCAGYAAWLAEMDAIKSYSGKRARLPRTPIAASSAATRVSGAKTARAASGYHASKRARTLAEDEDEGDVLRQLAWPTKDARDRLARMRPCAPPLLGPDGAVLRRGRGRPRGSGARMRAAAAAAAAAVAAELDDEDKDGQEDGYEDEEDGAYDGGGDETDDDVTRMSPGAASAASSAPLRRGASVAAASAAASAQLRRGAASAPLRRGAAVAAPSRGCGAASAAASASSWRRGAAVAAPSRGCGAASAASAPLRGCGAASAPWHGASSDMYDAELAASTLMQARMPDVWPHAAELSEGELSSSLFGVPSLPQASGLPSSPSWLRSRAPSRLSLEGSPAVFRRITSLPPPPSASVPSSGLRWDCAGTSAGAGVNDSLAYGSEEDDNLIKALFGGAS